MVGLWPCSCLVRNWWIMQDCGTSHPCPQITLNNRECSYWKLASHYYQFVILYTVLFLFTFYFFALRNKAYALTLCFCLLFQINYSKNVNQLKHIKLNPTLLHVLPTEFTCKYVNFAKNKFEELQAQSKKRTWEEHKLL